LRLPPEPPAPPQEDYFSKDQVNELLGKIRKEEKDKLYPRLSEMQERAKAMEEELRKVREANEATLKSEQEKREKEEAELARKHREEADLRSLLDEERLRREQQESEWQQQLQALKDEQALEKATLAKERQYLALSDYRSQRLAQERENDTIDPRLFDYIHGDSEEEIEQAITVAKAKTDEMFQEFAAAQSQRPAPRGVNPYSSPVTGPSDMITGGTKTFTSEDLKNMSMSEYQKYRASLLGAAKPQNRGLFD
jgi:hypothetical protein